MNNQNAEEVRGKLTAEPNYKELIAGVERLLEKHVEVDYGLKNDGETIYGYIEPATYKKAAQAIVNHIRTEVIIEQAATITAQAEEIERLVKSLKGCAEHNEIGSRQLSEVRQKLSDAYARDRGEVWYWQGDGTDDLETLTCPVQIPAESLRAMQAELHDVRQAVVEQCDLTGDYSYNDGNMIVWVSCVCCNEDWQHNEQPKHKEGCVYERCRQALAAEGGEGAI